MLFIIKMKSCPLKLKNLFLKTLAYGDVSQQRDIYLGDLQTFIDLYFTSSFFFHNKNPKSFTLSTRLVVLLAIQLFLKCLYGTQTYASCIILKILKAESMQHFQKYNRLLPSFPKKKRKKKMVRRKEGRKRRITKTMSPGV